MHEHSTPRGVWVSCPHESFLDFRVYEIASETYATIVSLNHNYQKCAVLWHPHKTQRKKANFTWANLHALQNTDRPMCAPMWWPSTKPRWKSTTTCAGMSPGWSVSNEEFRMACICPLETNIIYALHTKCNILYIFGISSRQQVAV